MIDFASMPLIEVAAGDARLRTADFRIFVLACRHLNDREFLPLKLDVLTAGFQRMAGRPVHRGNTSRAMRRLEGAGYVVRGDRDGEGGAWTFRLPATPVTVTKQLGRRSA